MMCRRCMVQSTCRRPRIFRHHTPDNRLRPARSSFRNRKRWEFQVYDLSVLVPSRHGQHWVAHLVEDLHLALRWSPCKSFFVFGLQAFQREVPTEMKWSLAGLVGDSEADAALTAQPYHAFGSKLLPTPSWDPHASSVLASLGACRYQAPVNQAPLDLAAHALKQVRPVLGA